MAQAVGGVLTGSSGAMKTASLFYFSVPAQNEGVGIAQKGQLLAVLLQRLARQLDGKAPFW
jgi:hypothetical protein